MITTGFTKLFSTIVTSTIWAESNPTRIVWITMLALADRDGNVPASVPGLARAANVTIEECEAALKAFTSPDNYSRTQDFDGRRIEAIDGGWRLLNYSKYREAQRTLDRTEYMRTYQARRRASKQKLTVSTTVNRRQPIAEAEAEAEAESRNKTHRGVFVVPSAEEVTAYSQSIGYPMDGQAWCDSYAQKGWMVGKNKMKNWKAAVRNWKSNGWMPTSKAANSNGDYMRDLLAQGFDPKEIL